MEFNRPSKPGRSGTNRRRPCPGSDWKSLPAGWLKPKSEAARFEAFRSLPEAAKLELLAYCVALTLKPKLGPAEGDEATAYDAALSLTAAEVAAYWRPSKDNFLGRINRDQLLAISREVLGNRGHNPAATTRKRCWSISSTGPSPIRRSQAGHPTRSRS